MPKHIRAVAIVVKQDKVLLMHRWKNGKEYHVFPGGGVEEGETIEDATIREIKEETTLDVRIDKLLYHHIYDDGSEQFFYLCEHLSGEPQPGDGPEYSNPDPDNRYDPEWVDVADVGRMLVYPLEIRDWFLQDYAGGFDVEPKEAALKVAELRRNL